MPFEVIKCRSQVNEDKFPNYRNDVKLIIQNEGVSALYKGYKAQFCKDVPSWAVYFWTYEYLKLKLGVQNDQLFSQESYRSIFYRLMAGGSAGVF